jgi:type II secretory pathway component PulM
LALPGTGAEVVPTLEAAAELTPPKYLIHFALPADRVVFERMTLPATDAAELEGMIQLQLEKTLPYQPEEMTSGFELIRRDEAESTVLALAISNEQLDTLCAPIHAGGRVPEKITVFAIHVARACPSDRLTLAVYCELGKVVMLISEQSRLIFSESFAVEKVTDVLAELPQVLLTAELEGVPTGFTALRVDNECIPLRAELMRMFKAPTEVLAFTQGLPEPDLNLLPPNWRRERERMAKRERLQRRLVAAAILYLVLVVVAFGYLIWLRQQVRSLDAQIREASPQVEFIRNRLARWEALAPAIDPTRYPVEILNQLERSRPDEGVRFTLFDQSREQFQVDVEAPSANLAIEFGEKLKGNPELQQFKFEISPLQEVTDEHAKLRIFGKL